MDVVFEGALSRSWSMADVLRGVMGVDNQPYGILRISSPGSNVSGRLVIADSSFIVGALVSDGSETGYEAARRLLMANDGNFAYLDTGGKRPQDFDQALYISLARVQELWPNLPAEAAELFDEKSLLDKVFGGDGKMPPDPSSGNIPIVRIEERMDTKSDPRIALMKSLQGSNSSAAGTGNSNKSKQSWQPTVQPLISSNSLVDSVNKVKPVPFNYELDDTGTHNRQSLTKLRGQGGETEGGFKELLQRSLSSKQAMFWFVLVVAVSAVATLVGTGVLNGESSRTMQTDLQRTQP